MQMLTFCRLNDLMDLTYKTKQNYKMLVNDIGAHINEKKNYS